jgi:hypothetical protein
VLEFTEEKLLKIIREEAVRKIVAEKKSDVENFVKITEDRDVYRLPQTGYLKGGTVASFQAKLGMTPERIRAMNPSDNVALSMMDGTYGRISTRGQSEGQLPLLVEELKLAIIQEIEDQTLGPYTHKFWELWVYENYTADAQTKVGNIWKNEEGGTATYATELARIFIDSDVRIPLPVPTAGEVALAWERSGRLLGWTIGTSERLQGDRSTTYHVENALGFMDSVPTRFGGFNPSLITLATANEVESEQSDDTQADSGRVGVDIDLSAGSPRDSTEPVVDYDTRIRTGETIISNVEQEFGVTALGSPTSPNDGTIGGLMEYTGEGAPIPIQFYFLSTAEVPADSRQIHPVFIGTSALDTIANQVIAGIENPRGPRRGEGVNPYSVRSWIRMIRFLGGNGGGGGGGNFTGSRQEATNGRIGYRQSGGEMVYDALNYVLSKITEGFEGVNIIDKLNDSDLEWHSPTEGQGPARSNSIRNLTRVIDSIVTNRSGSPTREPDTVKAYKWNPVRSEERTRAIRSSSAPIEESLSKRELSALSKIIDGAIVESFGVEVVQRRSRPERPARRARVSSSEGSTPENSVSESVTRVFSEGLSGREITRIQDLLQSGATGSWDERADQIFMNRIDQSYTGKQKTRLKSEMRAGGWNAMSAFLSQNNIGSFPAGPGGALSFLLDVSSFANLPGPEKRRLRRLRRSYSSQ